MKFFEIIESINLLKSIYEMTDNTCPRYWISSTFHLLLLSLLFCSSNLSHSSFILGKLYFIDFLFLEYDSYPFFVFLRVLHFLNSSLFLLLFLSFHFHSISESIHFANWSLWDILQLSVASFSPNPASSLVCTGIQTNWACSCGIWSAGG